MINQQLPTLLSKKRKKKKQLPTLDLGQKAEKGMINEQLPQSLDNK